MRHAPLATTLTFVLVACTDQVGTAGMMDAELPQEAVSGAALDRAPRAATMKEDERHPLMLAILDKLLAEHPDAAGGRVNLDGMFGGAYMGETLTHAGQSFKRVSAGAKVEKDTYTITFQDLKVTATNEAVMGVGLLHADEDGSVSDHLYEVLLVRDGDDVWTADLTYKGHFDGVLEGS